MKKPKKNQPKLSIWIPVIAAIMTGIFLLTSNWQKYWLEKPSVASPHRNEEPKPGEVHIKDNTVSGGVLIGPVEGGTVTINQYEETPNKNRRTSQPSSSLKTFRVVAAGDFESLVDELRNKYHWAYNNQAQRNVFEITFTGALESVGGSGLFLYRGGYLAVKKDGQVCRVLESIKVPAFDYPANPKPRLEEQIRQQVKLLTEQHSEAIAREIVKCLL